jgi:hypothetical protein
MLGSEAGGANACRVKGDENRFKIPEQGTVYTLLKGCRRQLLNIYTRGKLIYTFKLDGSRQREHIRALNSGLYFIKI